MNGLAWRNLWRRKRRTGITALSIGFGVLLAVTFTGIGDYSYTNMINAGADMGLGHISIEPSGYNDMPALDKRLDDAASVHEQVVALQGIDEATIRVMGQAMFASARKNVGALFWGVDPSAESPLHNLFVRSIVEGEMFAASEQGGAVVGARFAEKLGLALGKKLIYTTTDASGEIVSQIARVSAIFRTGVNEIDGAVVLLPIDRVRSTLGYGEREATLVAVTLQDHRRVAEITAQISALVGSDRVDVLNWKETQPDLAGTIAMDRSGNYVSQILVGLLIAAGIFNTLLMSVMERQREFGVMMAVGMAPRTLFRLVITESLWLAIIGLVAGVIITAPWYLYLLHVGIDLSDALGPDNSAGGVLIDPILRIRLFQESVIAILAGVFSLTLLSGLYPAWRAGRVPPVDSLKTI